MHSGTWKSWERRVAGDFGGVRRGPNVGNGSARSGENDVAGLEGRISIECKLKKALGFQEALDAAKQAEQADPTAPLAIGVLRRPGDLTTDALVVIRYPVFLAWMRAQQQIEVS